MLAVPAEADECLLFLERFPVAQGPGPVGTPFHEHVLIGDGFDEAVEIRPKSWFTTEDLDMHVFGPSQLSLYQIQIGLVIARPTMFTAVMEFTAIRAMEIAGIVYEHRYDSAIEILVGDVHLSSIHRS